MRCNRENLSIRVNATQDAEVMDRRDYYPFGMEMPERRWRALNEDAARFGFNGKENDNEVKGEGNQQDYGFRIYDPRVARFLSVDPLTSEYPWYTPYQFAGNTPVQAIDLDGLEPFFVMGTGQNANGPVTDGNSTRNTSLRGGVNALLTPLKWYDLETVPVDYGFSWNGSENTGMKGDGNVTLNLESDRKSAAEALAEYVIKNYKKGLPITLIGYSHGGNVSIQAIPIIRRELGPDVEINLITAFTPAYNTKSDAENPLYIQNGIKTQIHLFSRSDGVIPWALGGAQGRYNERARKNLVQIDVDKVAGTEEGHGSLYDQRAMSQSGIEATKVIEKDKEPKK